MRIEPSEKQALQAVGLRQDPPRHALPLQAEKLRQPVHRVGDVSSYELVLTGRLDIASGGVREGDEVLDKEPTGGGWTRRANNSATGPQILYNSCRKGFAFRWVYTHGPTDNIARRVMRSRTVTRR